MDITFLKEVVSQNPFRNLDKWPSVVTNVNATLKLNRLQMPDIAERTFKERLATLLKHFTEDNAAQLKKQVDQYVSGCVVSVGKL